MTRGVGDEPSQLSAFYPKQVKSLDYSHLNTMLCPRLYLTKHSTNLWSNPIFPRFSLIVKVCILRNLWLSWVKLRVATHFHMFYVKMLRCRSHSSYLTLEGNNKLYLSICVSFEGCSPPPRSYIHPFEDENKIYLFALVFWGDTLFAFFASFLHSLEEDNKIYLFINLISQMVCNTY